MFGFLFRIIKVVRKIPRSAWYVAEGFLDFLLTRTEGLQRKQDIEESVARILYFVSNLARIFSVIEQVANGVMENEGKKQLREHAGKIMKEIEEIEQQSFTNSVDRAKRIY